MMNSYVEVIDYLYSRLPMFTRDGASAINKGFDRILQFCEYLDNPQHKFKSIHIAGTNGKGSSSHMLTSVLETSGYKTGLYTSPHLLDFRERIRVHGKLVDQHFVVDFVNNHQQFIEEINPSFFEITVAMAFDFFAKEEVDIAIIEVGLGGRLDSTNIISPLACLITNIGMDHMNMLGNTLTEIAFEKAGIIKPNVPIVVSEFHHETAPVFIETANRNDAPLCFAPDQYEVKESTYHTGFLELDIVDKINGCSSHYLLDLKGSYQSKNILGVLSMIDNLVDLGFNISTDHVRTGLYQVQQLTGLQGRWQVLSTDPFIICDTGHNEDGIREVVKNLQNTSFTQLHILMGVMQDKDVSHILPLLPQDAVYYFSAPDMPRAMKPTILRGEAAKFALVGDAYENIEKAFDAAKDNYELGDLIFVGGSTFVVAEVLGLMTK